jgi:2-polyprenyl-6-hydroxyphenyl methylase/3-demethylubiquinone-9 3-methyltransferase
MLKIMTKSSIDKLELAKFEKLSSRWWDKDGEFKILHEISPLRIKYILDKVHSHFSSIKDLKFLDIGCGGGIVTAGLYKKGITNITGIDASSGNIKAASLYAKDHNLGIKYINTTAEELEGSFDVILCLEVLEHVASPLDLMKDISRLTKSGGMVILSTINRNLKSYMLSIVVAEKLLGWVPNDTHDYSKYIIPSELNDICDQCGLQLQELKGLNLDINILSKTIGQWKLTDDIDVNYFATLVRRC